MSRTVWARYDDPLSLIWQATATALGLTVTRTPDAYAMTDGQGTLALGTAETLDADDSLGQMIYHEICHWITEGLEALQRADWGMDNMGPDHHWREHACLRLQFVLCRRWGLEHLFAPTTDFREFWDQLDDNVLADRSARSVQLAILALHRSEQAPWAPHLQNALRATRALVDSVEGYAASPSVWRAAPPRARHPVAKAGLAHAATPNTGCGDCAWRHGPRGDRCRQFGARVDPTWPACERFEFALSCLTCGACCREAYHAVEVLPTDRTVQRRHPELVVIDRDFCQLRRVPTTPVHLASPAAPPPTRCAALSGGDFDNDPVEPHASPLMCTIYEARPRTCRDFTLGSSNCLHARRQVGLSL